MHPLLPESNIETESAIAADMAVCRALLANGSKTFYAASFLLPRHVREPASALYAFCRLADDAIDTQDASRATLDALRVRLARAYEGHPLPLPADRAFARAVRDHAIPREFPEALIEGFSWDLEARRYETLADLEAYAVRVAGAVGGMMAMVMGATGPDAIARACDLGVAMQLTNIARDVGEDAREGRLYLPRCWLAEEGIDADDWLAAPHHDARIARVVARLLEAAEHLYRRSEQGIAYLPADCRAGIRSARLLYAEIGRCVARQEFDSVSRRAVVPGSRKLALIAKAYATATPELAQHDRLHVDAARFLIDAALARCVSSPQVLPQPAWWNVPSRIARVIELIERLERIDRDARMQHARIGAQPALAGDGP